MHCGVVGLGFIGASRVAALRRSPAVTAISGVDQDQGRARAAVGEPGAAGSFGALLERDLDALFVCTPDPRHTDFVVDALAHGVPVFVEKPIATTLDDCARIIAAEERSRVTVTVGHSVRVNPRYAAVRRRVAEGGIGQLVSVATRRNWPLDEGLRMSGSTDLAMYLAVHEIDLLHWLAGERVTRVYAAAPPAAELPLPRWPTIAAICTLAGGAIATVETSWAVPDAAGFAASDATLQVMGTRGVLRATCPDLGAVAFGSAADTPGSWSQEDGAPGSFAYLAPEFPDGFHVDELELETHRFVRAVEAGTGPPVTSEDGAAAVAVAVAMQESLTSGRAEQVTYPKAEMQSGAVT